MFIAGTVFIYVDFLFGSLWVIFDQFSILQ